ncbi:MAG: hypothetical protein AAGG51_01495 [Cyanobacteria bacterium P01_G01_bin.54]
MSKANRKRDPLEALEALAGIFVPIIAAIILNFHNLFPDKNNAEGTTSDPPLPPPYEELTNACSLQNEHKADENSPTDEDENSPTDEEINHALNIHDACEKLINQGKSNAETHIDFARAGVFLWEYQKDGLTENERVKLIDRALESFRKAAKLPDADAKAKFYGGYSQDFDERVLNPGSELERNKFSSSQLLKIAEKVINRSSLLEDFNLSHCPSAKERYKFAIEEYKEIHKDVLTEYQNKREGYTGEGEPTAIKPDTELDVEEAYILIELGHWLNNRDRETKLAKEMYDIVLAHYSGTNKEVEHNALVGRGIAQFSEGQETSAVDLFTAALKIKESSEVRANLASSRIRSSVTYADAANDYIDAARIVNEEDKKFNMLLSAGYAYILQAELRDTGGNYLTKAKGNYDTAETILNEAKLLKSGVEDSLLSTAWGVLYLYRDNDRAKAKGFFQEAIDAIFKVNGRHCRFHIDK